MTRNNILIHASKTTPQQADDMSLTQKTACLKIALPLWRSSNFTRCRTSIADPIVPAFVAPLRTYDRSSLTDHRIIVSFLRLIRNMQIN
jgi:hypothetical protein